MLISALLACFAIRYLVDQVVLGIVLNLFALGLTGFLYEQLMQTRRAKYNQPPQVPQLGDPAAVGHPGARAGAVHTATSSSTWR